MTIATWQRLAALGAICSFASDDAAFMTGQVASVSGGLTTAV